MIVPLQIIPKNDRSTFPHIEELRIIVYWFLELTDNPRNLETRKRHMCDKGKNYQE
jgi:hypothetical protein